MNVEIRYGGESLKANIPREQEIAIYDYIYLNLMVEVLENKASQNINLDTPISTVLTELAKIKKFLHKNQIKVHPVKVDADREFVQYDFTCKVDGGYKEGEYRFWRAALTMTLNKKWKLLQQGEKIIESEL